MTTVVPDLDLDQATRDELTPPCEMSEHHAVPPAEWVVWWTCGCDPAVVLGCTGCKDGVLSSEVLICDGCATLFRPASTAVRLIEPLNRRPA